MNSIQVTGTVALISDIHWGKSKDSELRLRLLDNYLDGLALELKEIGVTTILFLGDWFDNRNTIHLRTGHHYSYKRMKKLASEFKIIMIPGNHDYHLKSVGGAAEERINSVQMFDELQNVFVFTEPTELLFDNGKTGLILPWGVFPEPIKKYDYLFGHFEWIGARMTGGMITTGISPKELLTYAPLVFTGHIHRRAVYEYDNGQIYSLGCPLELDWGDVGNIKGVYVLDPASSETAFIENTVSPRHIELLYSNFINGKITDFPQITGNFIKLVVDAEHTPKKLTEIINQINAAHPLLPAHAEFIMDSPTIDTLIHQSSGEADDINIKSIVTLPVREQICKYIEIEAEKFKTAGIDTVRLCEIALEFFDRRIESGTVDNV